MTAIIACIDDSQARTGVVDYAIWASKQLDNPLQFLHVLDKKTYPQAPDATAADSELIALDIKRAEIGWQQGETLLSEALRSAQAEDVEATTIQRHGRLPECVNMQAAGSPLIVIGKKGSDSKPGLFIGGQLENVVRSVNNPVLVAAPNFTKPRKVLIAYDNSPTAKKIIQFVANSNLLKGCELHLMMVGQSSGDNAALLNQVCETLRQAGFTVHANIQQGEVEALLLSYQKKHNIDLFVMGAYGHSRLRNFIVGSTTIQMLQATQLPMLLLR